MAGKLAELNPPNDESHDGIFIGQDLAKTLGVGVGDNITILTPQGTLNPFTGMMPRSRTMRVAGLFRLGLFEFDNAYGFVSLDVAKRLMNKSQPEHIELAVDDIYAAPGVAAAIPQTLGDRYVTQDWTTMNRPLFEALVAREDGDLDHDRPHRHGGRAQYRRLACVCS